MINTDPKAVLTLGDFADSVLARQADGKLILKLSVDADNQLVLGTDGGLYVGHVIAVTDSILTPLIAGVPTIVDVTANDACVGAAWSIVSMTNCTVTALGAGKFSVLGGDCSLGKWEFRYEVTCNDGKKSQAKCLGTMAQGTTSMILPFTAATSVQFTVKLSGGGTYDVDWGDGSTHSTGTSGTTVVAHTYSPAYTGNVTVTYAACSAVTELRVHTGQLTMPASAFPSTLKLLSVTGAGSVVSGNVSAFPKSLTYLLIQGSNTLTGNVADLSKALTYLYIQGSNTLTGNVADLSKLLTTLIIQGSNTLTGNVADLSKALTQLNITGSNTLTGNVADMAPTLENVYLTGANTVTASSTAWPFATVRFTQLLLRGASRHQSVIDNILHAALSVASWAAPSKVDLAGNAAPSAAGLADKATLQAAGVTVITA